VRQFTAADKRLLTSHNVPGGLGNCTVQEATALLSVTRDSVVVSDVQQDTLNMSVARAYRLQERQPRAYEHDYNDKPFPSQAILSEYKKQL
jgi:hypothetical protein